ncbi:type II toxin-antitoxin system Phd/YefM family antitoxin [Levilactobacillus brevis]|nr:type II toxin-antitoxin system Phd/YefM family antitoxin [Levilactobacillus brevis]
MTTTSFTQLHADPKRLFTQVIRTNHPLEVALDAHQSVVILSKSRYEQLLELNYLWSAGTLPRVLQQADETPTSSSTL